MSAAREEILARIAGALRDVPAAETPGEVPVARDYRGVGGLTEPTADPADPTDPAAAAQRIVRFAERVLDYHAEVRRVAPDEVGIAVTRACAERGLRRVAVPPGLTADWRPAGVELVEDRALTARDLDGLDGAVTGCAAAIAETGTLILDGSPRCGRRLLTLVPDHHICIVAAAQIADQVPAAIAAVAGAAVAQRRPITLVSGPSASSDIELARVEGVHGPRDLLVVIVDPAAPES